MQSSVLECRRYLRKKDNSMSPHYSNRITTWICLDSADTYFMVGRKFYKLFVLSFFCSFLFSSSLAPTHPPPPRAGPPFLSLWRWKLELKIREPRNGNTRPLLHTKVTQQSALNDYDTCWTPRVCLHDSEHRAPRSHWQSMALERKPAFQYKQLKTLIYERQYREVKWLLVNKH